MSELPVLSTLTLPPDFDADEALGLRDQMAARIAAVVFPPRGKKRPAEPDVALPDDVSPLAELPQHIDRPWRRFDEAATALQQFRNARALASAEAVHAASDQTEREAANTVSDDAWRAFEHWTAAAAGLAEDGASPSPSEARWLYTQLFPQPDGLRFITRRPRAQWAAMEQRMTLLAEPRARAAVESFGGARHLRQLTAAHARFGKAFGFTSVVLDPSAAPTDGRSQWLTCRDALRTLIQKLETYADPDIPGSEALAAFLLAPYLEMARDLDRSRRARTRRLSPIPAPDKPSPAPSTGG